MTMLGTLANRVGRLFSRSRPRLSAKYDSAQTNEENRKHWANADDLAGVTAMSADVRSKLRRRSRYECDNNCYAGGLLKAKTGDVVGTGPRLQVQTPDKELNSEIERLWRRWSDAINLPRKLRTLELSRRRDGECFAVFTTTERNLARTPITLDLRLIEAEQVASPLFGTLPNENADDGIEFGPDGEPIAYYVLKQHPGDNRWSGMQSYQADRILARDVIHWFQADRPTQSRGIPELTPALPLFAQLRRYTLATLTAAEVASMLAGVLHTDQPAGENDTEVEVTAFQKIELARGTLLTVPHGWNPTQFKPEQPTSGHAEFVKSILREAGRASLAHYGQTAGDSSDYNYSSARMDNQTGDMARDIEREQFRIIVLDRVFFAFMSEVVLAIPEIMVRLSDASLFDLEHAWHFTARPSIDPLKDATANAVRLENGDVTLSEIAAEEGVDWEERMRQMARENELARELGLPEPHRDRNAAPMPEDDPNAEPADAETPPRKANASAVDFAKTLIAMEVPSASA